jgi:GAF domain-containing protein
VLSEHDPADTDADDTRDADLRDALSGLSRMTIGSHDLSVTLVSVAEFAVHAIPGADGAGLTLLHDQCADTIVATAPFVREVDDVQYGMGEGPCIAAAATGLTMRSGSLGAESRWPRFGSRVGRLGVHSVLSLPLKIGGDVIGAMNVYSRSKEAFDDEAARLGEIYAAPAAVAVQNANALAAAVYLAQNLEKALHSRSDIDHAIGIIISRTGCDRSEAFDRLRAISQKESRKVRDVAADLVDDAARRARARRPQA